MKYLSPEIKALYKKINTKTNSLIRPIVSCGIFQDYDYNDQGPKIYRQQKTEK